MPLFSNSPFDQAVEKATSEMNISEDWTTILEICDKVEVAPNGSKECLKSICKALNSSVPHRTMHALTLLDACIKNCGRNFHLEVCSASFETELKKLLIKSHPKVIDKLKSLLKKWSHEDFKNDPELSLIPSLYNSLKCEKDYENDVQTNKSSLTKDKLKALSTQRTIKEEEDLAKAIELSLKESGSSPKTSSSLYPSASFISSNNSASPKSKPEPRKVRALYPFDAVEDNELTFETGELIIVLDDSDASWWLGSNHRGEGLFPANFVTSNLNSEPEIVKEKKTVQFSEEVRVKTLEGADVAKPVVIDEDKIHTFLHLLHEADPTGERPDSDELLALENHCLAMGPLIDKELEEIDRRHASLIASNEKLIEALHTYQVLMKDYSVSYSRPQYPVSEVQVFPQPPQASHVYGGTISGNTFHPAEAYQSLPVSTSTECFQVPHSGSLQSNMTADRMQSGLQTHIPFAPTNTSSFPSIPPNTGNFSATHQTQETTAMYYGDLGPNSMQHNPNALPMQHQPML